MNGVCIQPSTRLCRTPSQAGFFCMQHIKKHPRNLGNAGVFGREETDQTDIKTFN